MFAGRVTVGTWQQMLGSIAEVSNQRGAVGLRCKRITCLWTMGCTMMEPLTRAREKLR